MGIVVRCFYSSDYDSAANKQFNVKRPKRTKPSLHDIIVQVSWRREWMPINRFWVYPSKWRSLRATIGPWLSLEWPPLAIEAESPIKRGIDWLKAAGDIMDMMDREAMLWKPLEVRLDIKMVRNSDGEDGLKIRDQIPSHSLQIDGHERHHSAGVSSY